MIIILSPAKTLDFESPPPSTEHSKAEFLDESGKLVKQLKGFSAEDLSDLMNISLKLGELNHQRFQQWRRPFKKNTAKQSVFAFQGDVYVGLDAASLTKKQIGYAQKHLRILSGLYGMLKPLDDILPYRLEMGTRLVNESGRDLYQFWGNRLTDSLRQELGSMRGAALVNLASNEYSKVLDFKTLGAPVVTPVFKELKNGQYKIISFYAKKARGQMARYAIINGIRQVDDLKQFAVDGYRFNAELSTDSDWVFTRKQAN